MTQVEETPAAGPDLSHLPESLRLRIAVAVRLGWCWVRDPEATEQLVGGWALVHPDAVAREWAWVGDDGTIVAAALPDWENDPAAWGALMEREDALPVPVHGGYVGVVVDRECTVSRPHAREVSLSGAVTMTVATPGRAVMLAVLAKYGVEIPHALPKEADNAGEVIE